MMNAEYLENPARYEKLYKEHLHKAHSRIGSAFAKAGDTKANSTEIKSIDDPSIRGMKSGKRLLKLDWQLECGWNKIAWAVFETLLYDLELMGGESVWKKHRFVPAEAIYNFAEGYNIIGKQHRYIREVRDKLMPSRSPTIEIYNVGLQGGEVVFTFEFPFIRSAREATGMITDVFGRSLVSKPKEVNSLLPEGIRDATLVSVKFNRSPKMSKLDELVEAFDERLGGIIEGGFYRKMLAEAAWERHHRLKGEQQLQ
jgi:hypothetical protein